MRFDTNNKKPLAEGGEGIIYDNGSKVVKIYKPHVNLHSKQIRAQLLIKATLPPEVIKPIDVVEDNHNNFVGIVMPKVDGEDFKRLSNKKFTTSNNINTKDILEMLSRFWEILQILHKQNIFIGDLNDQNILFDIKTKKIFLIDTDSWSIGSEKCEVAMDLFKDPKLVQNNFNASTDIYSFCVLAWKSLTRIHPFGGTVNPDINIMERIEKGISVIDNPNVKIPKTTKTWRNLSPDMIKAFKAVFDNGDRKFGSYISDMLNKLAFCKVDNEYYFAEFNSCPMCDANATVARKATSIGVDIGFKIAQMLNASDIKLVYSEQVYLNTNNEVVDIKSGKKIPYTGNRCLFDNNGNIITCYKDYMKVELSDMGTVIPIQHNSYPIISDNEIYYISDNGYLSKVEAIGNNLGKKTLCKCSINAFFKVSQGNFCVVNIYDQKLIININGYYYTLDFDKRISSGDAHYDKKTGRWLILLKDMTSTYHSYVFENNVLKWQSDRITYNCPVYNVAFDSGVIYIPIDDAIRGLNIKTLQYKDFQCSAVNSDSTLIKKGNQFVIINDDNIYMFYK